jgi:hypothetical protein
MCQVSGCDDVVRPSMAGAAWTSSRRMVDAHVRGGLDGHGRGGPVGGGRGCRGCVLPCGRHPMANLSTNLCANPSAMNLRQYQVKYVLMYIVIIETLT